MEYDDGGDLLGGRTLPRVHNQGWSWSSPMVCVTFALIVFTVFWRTVGAHWYDNYRDANMKKYVQRNSRTLLKLNPPCRHYRRKFGIPDNDNDVFNVAYARAAQRRAEDRRKVQHTPKGTAPPIDSGSASANRQVHSPDLNNGSTYAQCESKSWSMMHYG